jgi:hypothetical protein
VIHSSTSKAKQARVSTISSLKSIDFTGIFRMSLPQRLYGTALQLNGYGKKIA